MQTDSALDLGNDGGPSTMLPEAMLVSVVQALVMMKSEIHFLGSHVEVNGPCKPLVPCSGSCKGPDAIIRVDAHGLCYHLRLLGHLCSMLWPETMLMPGSHATTENQADVSGQCSHLGSTVHAATEHHVCICGSDMAGGHANVCGPCYHLGSYRCLWSVLQPGAM